MRQYGWEGEIATDHEYPPNKCESNRTYLHHKKTREQAEFIRTSKVPVAVDRGGAHTGDNETGKRKPRREGLKGSFNDEVKVCVQSDIDELCNYATVAATLEADPTATNIGLYKEPKMRYETRKIETMDGNGCPHEQF